MPEQAPNPNPDNAPATSAEEKAGSASLNLSNRDLEIARLFAQGMSSKEMSRELMISETAAKLHTKAVMRKLNASSRSQVAAVLSEIANRLLKTGPQEGAEAQEFDDILSRLETGITQERNAMSVLLSKLRMTVITS